jgi:membrane protein DedA with SNARE-associated domain
MFPSIEDTLLRLGYPGLGLLMFVENVFPPIPSELIMPLAGYLCGKGELSFPLVVVVGTLGSLAGQLPLYALGRRAGGERLRRFAERHGHWITVSPADLERAERWFQRHGRKAVFFCRCVPGLRSLISIPAGMLRMELGGFLLFSALGAALWNTLLASAGRALGRRYGEVEAWLSPVGYGVLAVAVGIYLVRVVQLRRAAGRRRRTRSE